MKRIYLNYLTLLIASLFITVFLFVSCKKDRLTGNDFSLKEDESYYDSKSQSVIARIKDFETKLEDVKSGVRGEESYIDVDSALWNMESLFNVTFSSPEENYIDKKVQEFYIDIPICRDNNKLSMKDASLLYDDIIKSVKEVYLNDGFTQDKGLMSVVIDKGSNDRASARMKVTVVSGRTSTKKLLLPEEIVGGPFKYDECWYYGELGGSCDNQYLINDAAELLEDTINYYHGCNTLPEKDDTKNIYVDMTYIALDGDDYSFYNGNYYMFHKVNCDKEELYLSGNDLNSYYSTIKNLILNVVPKDSKYFSELSEESSFMEINIDGISYIDGVDMVYDHQAYILYGTKCEVPKSAMGTTRNILSY